MKEKRLTCCNRLSRLAVVSALASLGALGVPQAQAQPTEVAATRIAARRLSAPVARMRVLARASVDGIQRMKVLDRQTGGIEVVELDAQGREVPRQRVEALLAARRGADFEGRLEKELRQKVRGRPATETTTVLVWARSGPPPSFDREAQTEAAEGAEATAGPFRSHHLNATRGIASVAQARNWRVAYQAELAPVVVLDVPNDQLPAIEARDDVEAVYLGRVYRDELNASVPAINANTVWARGITGGGTKAAVVEGDGIYFAHSSLLDGTYCNSLSSSAIGNHATGVAGIIASTHATYKGVAPGAPALLSGNAKSYGDADIIACTEWAINNGARVINYSFGVDSTSSLAGLDRYVDYVVRNRAVTVVKSAGNKGYTCSSPGYYISSPGKGWNVLTVGNYRDQGTAANGDDVMNTDATGGSCFQDPASPHGDREKPEVAAPGTSITTTYCSSSSTCTGTGTGTSFSAPHVVGCSLLLMQRKPSLRYWPESVKAVLMASAAVNLEGSVRLSEHDGAGGIECDLADDVARGAGGGEQHGSFVRTDFPKTFTFSATAGQTVRVVVAWDSTTDALVGTTAPAVDVLKADLDLSVLGPTGTWVAGSASWDNSYEIVDFRAPVTGTYTAKVSAFRFDGSSEYVGLAWWRGTRRK